MGGGSYDGEVARESRSSNRDVFTYQGYTGAPSPTTQRSVHPDLNPHGTTRECMNLTPIVVAMDVTRSRGDDSRVIYAKVPMFIGQIELRNYVPGPAISFVAIGDATSGDRAPLQVGQFEADNRLDAVLGMDVSAARIVAHRSEHGAFANVDALSGIKGFARSAVAEATPWLTTRSPTGASPSS